MPVRLAFLLGLTGVAGLLASPVETAKRSRADIEAGLKALEAKHRAASMSARERLAVSTGEASRPATPVRPRRKARRTGI